METSLPRKKYAGTTIIVSTGDANNIDIKFERPDKRILASLGVEELDDFITILQYYKLGLRKEE